MDFAKAAMLIAAVLGLAALIKALVFGSMRERLIVAIVIASSTAGTFLVGASVWAKEQVVGGQHLDKLGVADKFVVVIFVAGAASAAWETLTTIKNVGQNQTMRPTANSLGGPTSSTPISGTGLAKHPTVEHP